MKLQNFQLEAATWSREDQRAALLDLREQVFILEQGVPEERERDGLDPACRHVLARDASGTPIGCARLAAPCKIGRMAVLPPWRGQGVGAAMLRELIACARADGALEATLDAQVSAIGFYERAGFVAGGEEFVDAGLRHRAMTMTLPQMADETVPLRDIDPLPASNRGETAGARLQLLRDARHRLCVYQPVLGNDTYASGDELEQLRRIAISGRGAHIRILLHDPAAALRNDHRLIGLAQRVSSAIHIRVPVEEADLAYVSAYLLNDSGGYLFLPEADRAQGRAARRDRPGQAPLQQHFDEIWQRAEPASALQTLDI